MVLPPKGDYGFVRQTIRFKIDGDCAKGSPYDAFSHVDDSISAEHDTNVGQRGAPCDSCGAPWPCPTVLGTLAAA